MAKKLSKSDIATNNTIYAWNVSQSVDAFASPNVNAYDISISGSLRVTGSIIATQGYSGSFSGSFQGDGTNLTGVTAEWDGTHVGDARFSGSAANVFIISGSKCSFNDTQITGSLIISGTFNAFRVDSDDIVLGEGAGASLEGGTLSFNVIIGKSAGASMTSGDLSVFVGKEAGNAIVGDYDGNVYVGYQAGKYSTTGENNIGLGRGAIGGVDTSAVLTGDNNISIGRQTAFYLHGDANNNICIGYRAGYGENGSQLQTGDGNILIGPSVDVSSTSVDKEIRIGSASLHPFSASLVTGDVLFPNDVKITGDIYAGSTSANGVIITSPNGTKYRIEVANDGALSTSAI